eukprot:4485321-Prymnesium_polylepis.2
MGINSSVIKLRFAYCLRMLHSRSALPQYSVAQALEPARVSLSSPLSTSIPHHATSPDRRTRYTVHYNGLTHVTTSRKCYGRAAPRIVAVNIQQPADAFFSHTSPRSALNTAVQRAGAVAEVSAKGCH